MFARPSVLILFALNIINYIYLVFAVDIVDLTWNFNNDTIFWKGSRKFEFTKIFTSEENFWYAVNEFCAAEHGGTHFDAPYHFEKQGWNVADVPAKNLITNGIILDVSKEVANSTADFLLENVHLQNWERLNGPFPHKAVLLVRFGWSQFWPNKAKYLRTDNNGNYHFPGISASAAKWIAESKKFVGVGVDTASVDRGISTDFIAHRIFSNHSMYNLENVKMLGKLPRKDFTLIVAPMKIQYGTGAAVRIFLLDTKL